MWRLRSRKNRFSYISYIGYMYFVTCDSVKNRKRKLNSLACTLYDTCVKTMHSMESTLVAQKSFETIFRRPSLFSIFRCILMPRMLTVFPCFTTWRKQKSYPQINLETSNDTSAGRPSFTPRQSPLTRDIAAKFRWNGHLQDISIVSGIPLPFRCGCRRKVFSALRRGRFLSRCPPVKRLFGVRAPRRMTLHSALTSYRCGSL